MATEIIFTPLPTGRDDDGLLHLSVHVTPRFTTSTGDDAALGDFPEFVSWPPERLEFAVECDPPGAVLRAEVVSQPDAALWQALFPAATTLVRSQDFGSDPFQDLSDDSVHTYPVTKIAQWLKDTYSQVAVDSPEDGPEIGDLLDVHGFEDLRFIGDERGRARWEAARDFLDQRLARAGVVDTRIDLTPNELEEATFDFFQLKEFFEPLDTDDDETHALLQEDVPEPTLDFHDAVRFCGQHATLMRLLGLAFDLTVRDEEGVLGHSARIRLIVDSPELATAAIRTPWMHSRIDDQAFFPAPRHISGPDYVLDNGFLRLDDSDAFEPIVVDAQGGGLKAVDFAGTLGTRSLRPTEGSPTRLRLPSLRADGLAVALRGNAQILKDAIDRGSQMIHNFAGPAPDDVELWAEDVVRGYRIDVWDSLSNSWHSLMRRQGQYEVAGTHLIPVQDEAFLVETTTRKPRRRDLFAPETLFGWDGWSLAVERPGMTHNHAVGADEPPLVNPPDPAPGGFDASFDFGLVPGTLPRLRFGASYRFRARTVDLAGNSVPASSVNDAHATAEILFGRFEPPQTPPVVLRTPRGPGESMEVVALRSNYDVNPEPATAQRHLTPPRVAQRTVELHGLLDVPHPNDDSVLVIDKAAYAELAERDERHLFNHPDGEVDETDRSDPEGALHYDVDDLDMLWVADPTARMFALRLLDGPHAGALELGRFVGDLSATWTGHTCVRLVLAEGDGAPVFDASAGVLDVPLRKGDLVHARLSSVLQTDELGEFGLWRWILDTVPARSTVAQLVERIGNGQHWMFEPFRVLTLTHAVRQPLLPPEFPEFDVSRSIGDTFGEVGVAMQFSRRSTSKVDVLASWREPVDNGPGTDPPVDVDEEGSVKVDRAAAFTLGIEHDSDDDLMVTLDDRDRHEFGDTKHRMVTYRGVATTRYGEFFTDRHEFGYDPDVDDIVLDTDGEDLVAGSVKIVHFPPDPVIPPDPVEPARPQHLAEGEHFTVDEETATITLDHDALSQLEHQPEAGEQFVVVYLVTPVTRETPDPPDEGEDEIGPRLIDVPSSARPDAPSVRYALPTFGWESEDLVNAEGDVVGRSSTRRGNGVRIYLDRPWWSSGEGELLAVVTWPLAELTSPPDLDSHPGSAEDLRRPFVTEWGEDPAYQSAELPSRYPRLSSFPRAAAASQVGYTLEELGGQPSPGSWVVFAAGHRVDYDEARDLWFCDIDVELANSHAYMPFIRFALARFQPSSIVDAHLSRVVLADFVQLAPDRFASVVLPQGRRRDMTVTLTGPTHVSTEATDGDVFPGTARVTVEMKNPGIEGELGWEAHGDPVEMAPDTEQAIEGQGVWTAAVRRPGGQGDQSFRLVIEQFEALMETSPTSGATGLSQRLVHTDIIDLPGTGD